jgi:hypothetical protein
MFRGNEHINILNSTFTGNIARIAGAISLFFDNTKVYISRCMLTNNYAVSRGGAMELQLSNYDVHIVDSVMADNTGGNYAGAVTMMSLNEGITFERIDFIRNTALIGGSLLLNEKNANITFESCQWLSNTALSRGGGLFVSDLNSDILINNCFFSENIAVSDAGGAVYSGADNFVMNNSECESNTALAGGALYLSGDGLVIENVRMAFNQADRGGALSLGSANGVKMFNLTVYDNEAEGDGGGMVIDTVQDLELSNSIFMNNWVSAYTGDSVGEGGAINIFNTWSSNISRVVFDGNLAASGGAMSVSRGFHMEFDHCEFRNNNAIMGSGGALFLEATDVDISSNAFLANSARYGGGALMWTCCDDMAGSPEWFSKNTYEGNIAAYGHNIGTNAIAIELQSANNSKSAPSLLAERVEKTPLVNPLAGRIPTVEVDVYEEPMTPFILSVVDKYGAIVVTDNTTSVKAQAVDIGQCKSNTSTVIYRAALSGVTTVTAVNGVANFSALEGKCYPGGKMHLALGAEFNEGLNQVITLLEYRPCSRGETQVDGTCAKCSGGYYNLKDGGGKCRRCPIDVEDCYADQLVLAPGYWRLDSDASVIRQCLYDVEKACPGGTGTGVDSCGEGYTGMLCASCDELYYFDSFDSKCKPCNNVDLNGGDIAIVVIVLLVVLGCIIVVVNIAAASSGDPLIESVISLLDKFGYFSRDVYPSVRKLREAEVAILIDRTLVRFKMVVTFLQIISAMLFNLNIPFPPVFQRILFLGLYVNLNFFPALGLGCYHDFTYIDELVAVTVSPFIFSFLIFLGYVILAVRLHRNNGSKEEFQRLYASTMNVFLLFTFLILPAVTSEIVRTFTCDNMDPKDEVDHDEEHFMVADYSISCSSKEYIFGLKYAIAMFFVYPVGLPLFYYVMLRGVKHRIIHRGEDPTRVEILHLRFLYDDYKPEFWWWEVLETGRRLLLTSLLSVGYISGALKLSLAVMFAAIFVYSFPGEGHIAYA